MSQASELIERAIGEPNPARSQQMATIAIALLIEELVEVLRRPKVDVTRPVLNAPKKNTAP